MIEHRKYIRLKTPIGIVYKAARKGVQRKPVLTFGRDLSGGGVSFMVKDELRCGALLEIEIQIPHLTDPIRAIGEVVWYTHEKERDREVREAGVRFRDIEPADLHRVLEYVHMIGIGT